MISQMEESRRLEAHPFRIPSRDRTDTLGLPFHEDGGMKSALLYKRGNEGLHNSRGISLSLFSIFAYSATVFMSSIEMEMFWSLP